MELTKFLIEAKLHTYASTRESVENLLEDGSKELTFIQGQLRYRDRFFGVNPLIGEELVWEAGRLIWGMNYFGNALEETVPASQIYNFLQQALRMIRPERPFRGPEFFRAGPFTYVDKSHGVLDAFSGEEVIYFRDQQVYHLVYHGGRMAW
jgi:hypothetical protein